ncbi:MAG: hypothetical protein FJW37_12055 [Acidobacteria bacterium]|nr:hypothetical protein [Acidobacteriota bacterium]
MICSTLLAALLMADGRIPAGEAQNEAVEVSASVYADKNGIRQLLGSDLGGYYVVVDIRVTPKASEPLDLRRDDFLLRTDKDGERARPFVASQIAGRGALIVSETGGGRGIMGDNNGPIWGGYPGSGERPRRMGGDGGGIGNASATSSQATARTGNREKDNPLKAVLDQRILEEKKTSEAAAGLLYFPIEAKQKIKDLELIYATPAGKLSLRFR